MNECSHENTETRKMSHCNQIKLQCLDCGISVGNAIKHAAVDPGVLSEIQEFDYYLRESKQKEIAEVRKREWDLKNWEYTSKRPERVALYQDYLRTPEWKEKRGMVIDRENGLCQGCRKAAIEEVHHATYATRGDELLFQLIGLCAPCHRKAHPEHNP